MARFFLKCLFLAAILLVGVFIGVQQASKGLETLQNDEPIDTFSIEDFSTETEGQVVGEKLTANDILKKHQQLEDVKSFNFFSFIGSFLSNVFDFVLDGFISLISKIIESIF
jgi:hypothetical protein